MKVSHAVAAFALALGVLVIGSPAYAQPGAGPKTPDEAEQAYPKAYVCANLQYNDVDDKPGTCKEDNTPLIPIRLGIAYKCLRGPADYQATEGPCRTTPGQPKGPVTVGAFWTCPNEPGKKYNDPGACTDAGKSARTLEFEERPHGDHNPRHGASAIYMSPDLFHHIEGVYIAPNTFRVYFYNEFTKPMSIRGFVGSVAIENNNQTPIGPFIPLTVSNIKDGNALEAKIPGSPVPSKASPVYLRLVMKFKPDDKDWPTDHTFIAYSKDPAPPAVGTPTPTGAKASPPAPAGAPKTATATPVKPQPSANAAAPTARGAAPAVRAPAPAARAAAPKPTPAAAPAPKAPEPPSLAPQESAPATTAAMSGGAEVGGGATDPTEAVPDTKPELLAVLKEKAENVASLVDEGQLGAVWFPALVAKNVGLALQEKFEAGMSEADRGKMASAVKQLTVVAWQIDAAGDLGNAQQIHLLRDQFEVAVGQIQALYGQAQ